MNKLKAHFNTLRFQLIVFYAVVCVAVLAVGSLFSYKYILDIFKENNEKYLLQQFSQSNYNISSLLNEMDRLSKLFVKDDDVQQFLQENYTRRNYETFENYSSILARIGDFISNYSYINSIYLFTENGGEIGSSATNTHIVSMSGSTSNPFFSSDLYKRANAAFPKITLGGGTKESYYNPDIDIKKSDIYIISIARGVKPIMEPSRSATLVMNIQESYLSSIYCSNSLNNYKYIVDSSGTIVSSSNTADLGKKSQISSGLSSKSSYGSFTSKRGRTAVQVVYYKLSISDDWYLIDEIPLSDFAQNVGALQKIIILVFCLSVLLTIIISYIWLNRVTKPLEFLSDKMGDMSSGKFGVTLNRIPKNEIGKLIDRFNEMSLSIAGLVKRNEEIQEEKIDTEIEALQAQINPHFIYNTLNMIKWMASMIHADNIVESIIVLGNLLRPVFKDKNRMWTVEDEIEYLKNYLNIMNWRYGNAVYFQFDIPDSLREVVVPKFILQPIVENSIAHGMQNVKKINILIHAYEEDGNLILKVNDTGAGMEPAKLAELAQCFENGSRVSKEGNSLSMGLYNVNRRIKLNFGEKYGIRLESTEGLGTTAYVVMPKKFKQNSNKFQS